MKYLLIMITFFSTVFTMEEQSVQPYVYESITIVNTTMLAKRFSDFKLHEDYKKLGFEKLAQKTEPIDTLLRQIQDLVGNAGCCGYVNKISVYTALVFGKENVHQTQRLILKGLILDDIDLQKVIQKLKTT